MATHKRNFASTSQIIGAADAYVTLSGTTESFSSDVDMATNGYEGAEVMVEINFDGTPTDDVDISFYGSLDGSAYDDVAFSVIRFDNGTDPNQQTFTIKDKAHFRVGAKQTGSTDSHDVRCYVKPWNWTDA